MKSILRLLGLMVLVAAVTMLFTGCSIKVDDKNK